MGRVCTNNVVPSREAEPFQTVQNHKNELGPTTVAGSPISPVELSSPIPFEIRGKLARAGRSIMGVGVGLGAETEGGV